MKMDLFKFKPQTELTEAEINKGLGMVIWDGLAAEVMTSFTGGAFLIAMALLMGANNAQIGILASLPMFTNVFQLISIWLVRKFNNRRAVAVYCSLLARIPLIIIGLSVWLFSSSSVSLLFVFLFFYYFFGSIAGPSWNSWMKDLVPEKTLGAYFSRRSRYTQILNIVLSISLAIALDYIKSRYPELELTAYGGFFVVAGMVGLVGAYLLGKAPEPQSYLSESNILSLFRQPLQDENFRRLLVFNSMWVFALNIATPFFIVFMMKSMGLSLSVIIVLSTISQLFSILTLKMWGVFADRYSNKSIIAFSAPIYIVCIIAWCFVGVYSNFYWNIILLVLIHIFSGITIAGINLSTANISLKLAPKYNAIVYLSVQNIVVAIFSSIAPLIGGVLADFFSNRTLRISIEWVSPLFPADIRLLELKQFTFLFVIGAVVALFALNLLNRVKEVGEVKKGVIKRIMRTRIRSNLKDYFLIGDLINLHRQLKTIVKANKNRKVEKA